MFIGCDVSGQLKRDRYWVLGSVWIPKEQLPRYEEAIVSFRLRNKLWGELKWDKITPQELKGYKEFLNISLQKFPTEIKILLRDKQIKPPKKRFKNRGEMLSTFYYLLLRNHIKRISARIRTVVSFDILFDKEDWMREQSLNLKKFLKYYLITEGFKERISYLSQCDSKILSLLQLCDLITGAVSAKINQPLKNISNDKKEIIKYIENILNHSLNTPTLPTATKFNLWLWRPHRGFY